MVPFGILIINMYGLQVIHIKDLGAWRRLLLLFKHFGSLSRKLDTFIFYPRYIGLAVKKYHVWPLAIYDFF